MFLPQMAVDFLLMSLREDLFLATSPWKNSDEENKVLRSLTEPPDRSKQTLTNAVPWEQGLLQSHYKQVPGKGKQPAIFKTIATWGEGDWRRASENATNLSYCVLVAILLAKHLLHCEKPLIIFQSLDKVYLVSFSQVFWWFWGWTGPFISLLVCINLLRLP